MTGSVSVPVLYDNFGGREEEDVGSGILMYL